jgi:hypothetical protein
VTSSKRQWCNLFVAEADRVCCRAVSFSGSFDPDPLPVPDMDLGQAAAGHLTGTATIALPGDRLDDDGFERLLYDLLRNFPEHQNVQWLMQTRGAHGVTVTGTPRPAPHHG